MRFTSALLLSVAVTASCTSGGSKSESPDASLEGTSTLGLARPSTADHRLESESTLSAYVDQLRMDFVGRGSEGRTSALVIAGTATGFDRAGSTIVPRFDTPSPKAVRFPTGVSLPATAGDALSLTWRGARLHVRLENTAPAGAELAGDAVVYRDAVLNGTLITIPHAEGAEDYLHLAAKPASNELRYRIRTENAPGLRLVEGVLEILTADGTPMFHTTAPIVVDAKGVGRKGTIAVEGCAYDSDVKPPFKRAVTAPGADSCVVVMRWDDASLAYPILVDPAWTTAGSMTVRRAGHTVAPLYMGGTCGGSCPRLVAAGGTDATPVTVASAEMYDEGSSTWATIASMNTPRMDHGSATDGRYSVVVAGGNSGSTILATAETYNICCGWKYTTGNLPHAVQFVQGAFIPGSGGIGTVGLTIFTGGRDASCTAYTDVTKWTDGSFANGTLSTLVDATSHTVSLANARAGHAMAAWNGGFFVAGGTATGSCTTPVATAEFMNVSAGVPTASFARTTTDLSVPRSFPVAVTLDDYVVVAGGGATGAVDLFKIADKTLSAGDPIRIRLRAAGGMIGTTVHRALFAGGENGSSSTLSTADVLEPPPSTGGTGKAVAITNMTHAREFQAAARLEAGPYTGGVMMIGGSDCCGPRPTIDEIYMPSAGAVACSINEDCMSNVCADGVCCNTACGGTCQACNVPGSVGTCTTLAAGSTGTHGGCPSPSGGTCGYVCNGSDALSCHTQSPAAPCSAATCVGTTAQAAQYCAAGICPAATPTTCPGNLSCNSATGACRTTCTVNTDCASGYKCASGVCVTAGGPGAACGVTSDCDPTKGLTCVDSVCCTTSSCGAGQKCNITGVGTCALPFGAACDASTASQCSGGVANCVDGVCCNSPCNGQCQACDVPLSVGTCTTVLGTPHGTRTKCIGTGACQAKCDGSSATSCGAAPGVTSVCAAATCTAGSETPTRYCDGLGVCASVSSSPCSAYVCGPTACLKSCSSGSDCTTGYTCKGGACFTTGGPGTACTLDTDCASSHCVDGVCCTVAACTAPLKCNAKGDGTCSKPLKTSCATDAECGSGHCADGVCCDKACGGQCEACDVGGSEGTCTAVAGPPHGTRTACTGTGACKAQCDGSTRTSCGVPPGTSTVCAAPTCTGSTLTPSAYCDGLGACTPPTTASCGTYACGAASCRTSCSTNADCASAAYVCKAGSCVTAGGIGTVCADDTECTSGHCVTSDTGRVCCTVASCGAGMVCSSVLDTAAPPGTCVALGGGACTTAAECTTGFCVDGRCCDGPCNGQCEACDVDSRGKCTGVTGTPHGTRTKCNDGGSDVCKALTCDGTKDRNKCAAYASGLDTECAAATCKDGNATTASTCDGAGACKTGATTSCGAYACGTKACKTTCATDSDCATGYGCDAPTSKCVPQKPTCSSDGVSSIPPDKGAPKGCAAYLCDPATGNCYEKCTDSNQCAAGFSCNAGVCQATPPADTSDSGGCQSAAVGAPVDVGTTFGCATVVLLLAAAATRRRRQQPRDDRFGGAL